MKCSYCHSFLVSVQWHKGTRSHSFLCVCWYSCSSDGSDRRYKRQCKADNCVALIRSFSANSPASATCMLMSLEKKTHSTCLQECLVVYFAALLAASHCALVRLSDGVLSSRSAMEDLLVGLSAGASCVTTGRCCFSLGGRSEVRMA
jgi:hypothetical protein